jgi:hypothetical protein
MLPEEPHAARTGISISKESSKTNRLRINVPPTDILQSKGKNAILLYDINWQEGV